MKKRMFQILDEMNQDDIKNDTKLIAISNTLIGANKVLQGSEIIMGADEECMYNILSDKYIAILVVVNKEEYFKRQNDLKKES